MYENQELIILILLKIYVTAENKQGQKSKYFK